MDGYEQQPFVEQPVAEPAPPPSRRGLIAALIAGIAVAAAIIVGILIWRASHRPTPASVAVEERIVQEEAACASAQNPEACKANAVLAIAQETGRGDLCTRLTGDDRDLCVSRDAEARQDSRRCDDLSTEERKAACADAIELNAAVASGNSAACERLSAAAAESCRSYFASVLTSAACRQQGKDTAQCDAIAQTEAAAAAGDLALCAGISIDEERFRCEDRVGGTDADGDGLSAYDERTYGTDARNPDTDGDGFSDGVEVSGGYNPNGPGRL